MNIIYKKLEPQNSRQYREIRLHSLQLHPESYGTSYEEESAVEKLFFEKCIEEQNEFYSVIGAFSEEKLIGITTLVRNKHIKTRHRAEIIQVFVLPQYRNKNIATNILQTTINEAKKIKEIEQLELGVATHNIAAISVYQKMGFKTIGTIPKCLKINDKYIDENLMVLFI